MKTSIAAITIICLYPAAALAEEKSPVLLYDGCALNGAQGSLLKPKDGGLWLFKLDQEVTDGKSAVAAAEMTLLPSSGLQRLIADANESGISGYMLWGRVTKYRERNFIFPMQYLAAVASAAAEPNRPQEANEQAVTSAEDANDAISLPVEVMEKLRSRRVIRTEQLKKPLDITQDSILADRTGFILQKEERAYFMLDSLGRNVTNISFELLPCEALERAQEEETRDAEQVRMKAAGVVTQYEGRYYLLLQRASRIYGHGNFAR
jgi:hypothetical protein